MFHRMKRLTNVNSTKSVRQVRILIREVFHLEMKMERFENILTENKRFSFRDFLIRTYQ